MKASQHFAGQLRMKTEIVHLGLGIHVDERTADSSGKTPLIVAARVGDRDIGALLLDAGADFEVTDSNGQTALHPSTKISFP